MTKPIVNLAQASSQATFSIISGCLIGLSLWLTPSATFAHAGHDHEFTGGNAEQIMQPLTIDTQTATALGLKTTAITAAGSITVPSTSVVEANGSQLVYVQTDGMYKPVPIKAGKTTGDQMEIAEGNLKAGDQVVTQGATLLYSEALRRKPQTAADHEHGPHTHTHDGLGISRKKLALGIGAGTIVGAGIVFGLTKLRRGKSEQ